MKNIFLFLVFAQSITLQAQNLTFEQVNSGEKLKKKYSSYTASNGNTYNIGDTLFFNSDLNLNTTVTSVSRLSYLGLVGFQELQDYPINIARIKVNKKKDTSQVYLDALYIPKYTRYKVDIEKAVKNNEISNRIENTPQKRIVVPSISDKVIEDSLLSSKTFDPSNNAMLIKSAVELKRFTSKYNTSVFLTMGGGIITTLALASNQSSAGPWYYLGGGMSLTGLVFGISARQHIGKSGAYLEAYANGVIITF